MSFSFKVTIAPEKAKELAANGYYLAVQKATPGTTTPVQWITFKVRGQEIQVSWVAEYGVYFTTTAIQEGAVITQTTKAPAQLGRIYAFKNTEFTNTGPGTPGTITIFNDDGISSTFGITQSSTDSSGQTISTPVAVAPLVLPLGSANFAPTEKVTIYFGNIYTQGGTVVTVSSGTYTATISPGVVPTFYYDDQGRWTQQSVFLPESVDPILPLYTFRVALAGHLPLYAVQNYFAAHLAPAKVVVTEPVITGSVYNLTVLGPDPWGKLKTLIGQEIDNVIKVPISPDYFELGGRGAVIEVIVPLLTPLSSLWNTIFKHPAALTK